MRTSFCSIILGFLLLSFTLPACSQAADNTQASKTLVPITSLLLGDRVGRLSIAQLADYYAAWSGAKMDANDRETILAEVDKYPPGGIPPYFVESSGNPALVIESRGAAFYILGVMAVTGNSRTAALWCFAEAARRNPDSVMFLNNFAFMLLEFAQFRPAQTVLEYVAGRSPDFLSARVNLALAHSALGKFSLGGAGMHKAVALFPQQADYYRLGSQAYHLAGQEGAAWSLASLGAQYHSADYDFSGLLSALDYPATSLQCTMPPSCLWNSSCLDFAVYGSSQPLADAKSWEGSYIANTLNPSYLNLVTARQQCQQSAANRLQICLASTPQPLTGMCYCRAWIEDGYCDLGYEQAVFGSEAVFHGLLYGRYLQAQGETQSALNGVSSGLQVPEYQYLDCKVRDDFAQILDGVAQDERDTLAAQMQYILIARNNLNTIVAACNQSLSNFELWMYTSGASFSSEPAVCYGPVCVSFDSDGKVAVSFAFGPAIKLSYDPLKEDWGFAIGVGVQFGVGQWAAGAAVLLKADNSKIGLAVTGGALYTSAEQFFGFQRIPVKVSYP